MSFGVKLVTAVGGSVNRVSSRRFRICPEMPIRQGSKDRDQCGRQPTSGNLHRFIRHSLFWYKLDKKRMDVIYADLDKRKQQRLQSD